MKYLIKFRYPFRSDKLKDKNGSPMIFKANQYYDIVSMYSAEELIESDLFDTYFEAKREDNSEVEGFEFHFINFYLNFDPPPSENK